VTYDTLYASVPLESRSGDKEDREQQNMCPANPAVLAAMH